MALIVENFLLIPLAIVMMEWGQSASSTLNWRKLLSQIVRRVFSNPIIIAIIIGIFLSLLDLGLPTVMDRSLETLANSAAAVSLVFIGAILCGRSIQTDKRDIGIMAVFKLLVHPLIVYLAIRLLPDFDPQLQTAAILLAAVPIFTIYPIIGSKYGLSSLGAGALVFATACSFVTISVVLYLLL
jgi:predicted permease